MSITFLHNNYTKKYTVTSTCSVLRTIVVKNKNSVFDKFLHINNPKNTLQPLRIEHVFLYRYYQEALSHANGTDIMFNKSDRYCQINAFNYASIYSLYLEIRLIHLRNDRKWFWTIYSGYIRIYKYLCNIYLWYMICFCFSTCLWFSLYICG